jgi:hypothetical protein
VDGGIWGTCRAGGASAVGVGAGSAGEDGSGERGPGEGGGGAAASAASHSLQATHQLQLTDWCAAFMQRLPQLVVVPPVGSSQSLQSPYSNGRR